jgi:phosphatidylserine/phosphatidylglycerophosphate/cardiolipin synthase-like enzyme
MHRFAASLFALLVAFNPAGVAQDTLPPSQGGYVHSLGLPERYKPYFGFALGLSRDDGDHLASQLRAGLFRDIGNPITELLGWSVEAYGGVRDLHADYGGRAFLLSHILGIGAGLEYSIRDGHGSPLAMIVVPGRRGGILGGGSDFRLEWLPGLNQSFNVGVTFPWGQPNRGKTRPIRDYVPLRNERVPAPGPTPSDPTLVEALEDMWEHALWIDRLTVPALGGLSADPGRAASDAVPPLKVHLSAHTVEEEIRSYHLALTRAFSIAASGRSVPRAGSTPEGRATAASAKTILLDRVLFPYDRLIGQPKKEDTTREFAVHARGVFARWLSMSSPVRPDRDEACLYVFQRLLDIVGRLRAENHRVWHDSRLVWLPLQLAMLPEQYDDQIELDTIISRAVGHYVTHGNRIGYVLNDRFQQWLEESIAKANKYHVLWIHDFSGLNDQRRPDRVSLLTVTRAYLAALRRHLASYDSTGHLPAYMIFIDQHYFEKHKSRDLLRFLEDPLGRRPDLPAGFDALTAELATAQRQLREAVEASRLLTAERAQYGERWLHRLVSVHVSVTNPADPSFRSEQILPLIGLPDDVIRDHRKAAIYDVDETAPYVGEAVYGGMGVGEHYVGPSWEDRAITVRGPIALTLRDEARALLESQGLREGRVPHALRPKPKAPGYDAEVLDTIHSMDVRGGVATRAIALENETGFGLKEISVAEATLFSLAAPGAVLKIPDSLWLNQFLASLLVGAALRGTRVLVIAPSQASAPGKGWPTLTMMHDLMSRLLTLQHTLAQEYRWSGGFVRVGLYDPKVGVHDFRDRLLALANTLHETPFLRQLYSFDPAVLQVLNEAVALSNPGVPGDTTPASIDSGGQPILQPMLHMKAYLYISGEAWKRLISGPPMAEGLREYLGLVAKNEPEDTIAARMQVVGAQAINRVLDGLPDEERDCRRPGHCAGKRWVFYLQVGSPNQDYRSMALDGEAAVLVSTWTALYGVPDFVLLTGLTAWPETQADLDELLPPHDERYVGLAWWVRMAL